MGYARLEAHLTLKMSNFAVMVKQLHIKGLNRGSRDISTSLKLELWITNKNSDLYLTITGKKVVCALQACLTLKKGRHGREGKLVA